MFVGARLDVLPVSVLRHRLPQSPLVRPTELVHLIALYKEEEGGVSSHSQLRCQRAALVAVDLEEDHPPPVVCCQLVEYRFDHLTGAAPLGADVHHDELPSGVLHGRGVLGVGVDLGVGGTAGGGCGGRGGGRGGGTAPGIRSAATHPTHPAHAPSHAAHSTSSASASASHHPLHDGRQLRIFLHGLREHGEGSGVSALRIAGDAGCVG